MTTEERMTEAEAHSHFDEWGLTPVRVRQRVKLIEQRLELTRESRDRMSDQLQFTIDERNKSFELLAELLCEMSQHGLPPGYQPSRAIEFLMAVARETDAVADAVVRFSLPEEGE